VVHLPFLSFVLAGCASSQVKGGAAPIEETQQQGNAEPVNNIMVSSFILGVGDSIDIAVYRNDDLKKSIKIDSSGRIMFPLIGDVQAAGKDIFRLRDEMQKNLYRSS
jgi:polysaccharide export outer membrane protein